MKKIIKDLFEEYDKEKIRNIKKKLRLLLIKFAINTEIHII